MRGTITGRDVLMHPAAIIGGFGVSCYLRCLCAVLVRERTTFLALVTGRGREEAGQRYG